MTRPQAPARLLDLSGAGVIPQHPEGGRALPWLLRRSRARAGAWEALRRGARRRVAALVGVVPDEVVLTSGGAEASNAGLKGLALAALSRPGSSRRIVISDVEHAPVFHAARGLERLGFQVVRVPVDGHGIIDLEALGRALAGGAAVAAVQWANDETGAVQPVEEAAALAARAGVPLHADATAAAGWLEVDLARTPIPSLSISSRRMGGPLGAGALILRQGVRWFPLIEGGMEEDGRRAGVQHPALAAAFGITAAAARRHLRARARVAEMLREALAGELAARVPGATLPAPARRLPGHLPVRLEGARGEALLVELERRGILGDSGDACAEGAGVPSRILRATGLTPEQASGTLLFRLSASTPSAEPPRVAAALAAAAARLRELAP